MPGTLRTAIYAGDRRLTNTARRFGDEFRLLRLRSGASQAAVARGIGVDRATICRLEAGDRSVSNQIRARAAAILGAELSLGLFPVASPLIHDAGHARLVERVLRMRHSTWKAVVEAPIPGGGRRSSDIRLDRGQDVVLIEVETRVHVLEALIRETTEKRALVAERADGRSVHIVLAMPPSRHNRGLVADHQETIRTAYPAGSAAIAKALTEPTASWPGDGILWLGAF